MKCGRGDLSPNLVDCGCMCTSHGLMWLNWYVYPRLFALFPCTVRLKSLGKLIIACSWAPVATDGVSAGWQVMGFCRMTVTKLLPVLAISGRTWMERTRQHWRPSSCPTHSTTSCRVLRIAQQFTETLVYFDPRIGVYFDVYWVYLTRVANIWIFTFLEVANTSRTWKLSDSSQISPKHIFWDMLWELFGKWKRSLGLVWDIVWNWTWECSQNRCVFGMSMGHGQDIFGTFVMFSQSHEISQIVAFVGPFP